ncbi:unnamed protein product, partial [Rotaria magnacalcarata]
MNSIFIEETYYWFYRFSKSNDDYARHRRARDNKEYFTDILLQSYQNLNKFLCAFIDHALPTHQYVIRNRYFLEKVFNFEFQVALGPDLTDTIDNFFFV